MKRTITTIALAAILSFGANFANAGIIVAGLSEKGGTSQPCVETPNDKFGIIVAGFTGIIVAGFTGIIVAGFAKDDVPVNCGIIVAG